MKVLKFGGSAIGNPENICNLKKILSRYDEKMLLVVAAFNDTTDHLIDTASKAVAGDESYTRIFDDIAGFHREMARKTVLSSRLAEVETEINRLLDELGDICKGVFLIRDLSPKTLDAIVSYGERLSALIVCNSIENAELYDARQLIKTVHRNQRNVVDFETSNKLINGAFTPMPAIGVVTGYISSDRDSGEVTNLGRGGSDYTAAIIAAATDADALDIWTTTDGFMTADQTIIDSAYTIEHLSFVEAMELCNFGVKVIYPPTIFPVCHKNIPIHVRNVFKSSSPGTTIDNREASPEGKAIKGISSVNDTCLITVSGLGMVGVIGINSRIFDALARSGISVFLVSQAASENNISFAVRNADADNAVNVIRQEFAQEIAVGEINNVAAEKNLATVAIVGENMKHTPGIAGKLFNTLGRNGINVIACAQGASETNISFVITLNSLRKALNVIHDSFFLSEAQVLNLFVAGIGTVGRNLLEQISSQQSALLENKALKINIVGIANSRHSLFDREGIDMGSYRERLEMSELGSSPEIIRSQIVGMNIFNSVFVDCTANEGIASIYRDLLEHNVSVVAANKIAASSAYDNYIKLKQTARRRDVKYLFETNVGAGLPIINTINSLINSGDRILKIEAVVSGTLNYIFSTMSSEVTLSRAIAMAKEAGYSEPDPRLDLNGADVIRKLVILAREAGYKIEQADVERQLFIPDSYFKGTIEEFWKNIPQLDAQFEALRQRLEGEGKRLRFVAGFENGKASVGLKEIDSSHPFYQLEGSNNVILLTTERYKEYPMVIKGYGAGAAVTAAGVFADIISIANIR